MTHIRLDSQHDAVKAFVRSLLIDPQGAVLELDGQAILCIVPPPVASETTGPWYDSRNARRCLLIDRDIAGSLTPPEAAGTRQLQTEMLRHRRAVAPLPLDDARRLHQKLLASAAGTP